MATLLLWRFAVTPVSAGWSFVEQAARALTMNGWIGENFMQLIIVVICAVVGSFLILAALLYIFCLRRRCVANSALFLNSAEGNEERGGEEDDKFYEAEMMSVVGGRQVNGRRPSANDVDPEKLPLTTYLERKQKSEAPPSAREQYRAFRLRFVCELSVLRMIRY